MRLFFAVKLDNSVQKQVNTAARTLRRSCQKGNFTLPDHFHITLLFLGETAIDVLEKTFDALDDVEGKPFEAMLEGLGAFVRPRGDIYWMDVHPKEPFKIVHDVLYQNLADRGIEVKKEVYRPHVTLGRQIILQEAFQRETILKKNMGQIAFSVSGITLMRSDRINGELVYTPIREKQWKVR